MAGQRLGALLLAPLPKEVSQQRGAGICQNAALDLGLVVQLGVRKQVEHGSGRPRLGLGCAENHAVQPRVEHGATAHRAGLQRHIQRAAIEPVVAQLPRCCTQGHDLRMRGRVVAVHRAIAARGNDLPAPNHHRAHRHLASTSGSLRLGQRKLHKVGVGRRGHCYLFDSCKANTILHNPVKSIIFQRLAWTASAA